MALGVIASLVMLELLPESIELLFETYNREITIVMVWIFGFRSIIIMTLENFILIMVMVTVKNYFIWELFQALPLFFIIL